ncbi:hypothetical protein [Methylobacterium sp. E-046]|uniref:hypothetical protein n=1 Tax=Methylobacterium sp. E-046 TaxID=2836576 RepID=UPI001FBADDB4|nr:hypothetical protein [Methylobacterium sp. E-046]MCJ2097917.1 hypothetical protein [Methylobacterium sp. E-046]
MATHAYSTRTPLLPLPRSVSPLLGQGLGRQPGPVTQVHNLSDAQVSVAKRQQGPVTQAIRAMRAADPLPPADAAIEAIREGLIRYFVEDDGANRQLVRELRRRIADRIEADLALLDALDPDPDLEDGHDAEGNTDDNGLGDSDALGEQDFRGYGGCL